MMSVCEFGQVFPSHIDDGEHLVASDPEMVIMQIPDLDLHVLEGCQQRRRDLRRVCRCLVVADMSGFAMDIFEPEIATCILADLCYQRKSVDF